jgi:hypothetical protein
MFSRIFKKLFIFLIVSSCTFALLFIYSKKEIKKDHSYLMLSQRHLSLSKDKVVLSPIENTPIPTTTPIATPSFGKAPAFVYYKVGKNDSIGHFVPPSLVQVQAGLASRKIEVSPLIINDLTNLIQAAKADNIFLQVVSGYRSYDDQANVFEGYVQDELKNNVGMTRAQAEARANEYSAYAGHSEHQLGTTVDVLSDESNYTFTINQNMKFVKWIEDNATKFNFHISYTKNNGQYQYEPWHVRWLPAS